MRSDTTRLLGRLGWLCVAGLVAAYIVLFATQAADIMDAAAWNPDAVITWVLAESAQAPGPHRFVEGSFAFYSVTWFNLLTADLPAHRVLWMAQPIATALVACGLLAFTVKRLAGRRAAVLALVLLLCVGPVVMAAYLRPTFRVTSLLAVVVVAAFVVELGRDEPFGGRQARVAAAGVVAIVLGVHLVDNLLWAVAVGPLLAAVALVRVLQPGPVVRRAAWLSAGVVVGAVAVRFITVEVMRRAGYDWLPPTSQGWVDGIGQLRANAGLLVRMVANLGNGMVDLGTPGSARDVLELACSVVAVCAVLVPLALLVRVARRHRGDVRMLNHVAFWAFVVLGNAAAVLLTTVATDLGGTRYIVPMLFAVAATLPLLVARRGWPATVALAATAVYAGGVVLALADKRFASEGLPSRTVPAIERYAAERGVRRGFGDYAWASNVTWAAHGRVESRPVLGWARPNELCEFVLARDSAWYRPRPGPTFLLWPSDPPSSLGAPVASRAFPGVRMYVYDYDIADRLCPPPLVP